VRGAAPRIFFDDFQSIFVKKNLGLHGQNSWKYRISKSFCDVTDRPNILGPSHRKVKNVVWKYLVSSRGKE